MKDEKVKQGKKSGRRGGRWRERERWGRWRERWRER